MAERVAAGRFLGHERVGILGRIGEEALESRRPDVTRPARAGGLLGQRLQVLGHSLWQAQGGPRLSIGRGFETDEGGVVDDWEHGGHHVALRWFVAREQHSGLRIKALPIDRDPHRAVRRRQVLAGERAQVDVLDHFVTGGRRPTVGRRQLGSRRQELGGAGPLAPVVLIEHGQAVALDRRRRRRLEQAPPGPRSPGAR